MYVCFSALNSDAINSCHYSRQQPKSVFLHPEIMRVRVFVCVQLLNMCVGLHATCMTVSPVPVQQEAAPV